MLDNDRTSEAGPGSLVYVPRGNLHTYKNVGDKPGRLLVNQAPGGLHERFFEELGAEATDKENPPIMEGPPDVEKIVAIAARNGIEIPPSGSVSHSGESRASGYLPRIDV